MRGEAMIRRSTYVTISTLFSVVAPAVTRAEASHHQASAGQVISTTIVTGAENLTARSLPPWELRLFPSVLTATGGFDDAGNRIPLVGADRVTNHTLNAYVERRFGERWALSALASAQHLALSGTTGTDGLTSLGDAFLSIRHTDPVAWGSFSVAATVKVPGTYPESAVANSKQLDGEAKVLFALREFVPRVSAVLGSGYRLRLGGVKDEITGYVFVPIRIVETVTLTPGVSAAAPIGLGDVAKNVVTPGVALAWQAHAQMDVTAGYYRTVIGRNVVEADIFSLGAGYTF